jgi:hypothetical protein
MDDIVKVYKRETKFLDMGNRLMKPVKISELAFADDLILMAKSEDLHHNLNVWNSEMARRNKRRTSFNTSETM